MNYLKLIFLLLSIVFQGNLYSDIPQKTFKFSERPKGFAPTPFWESMCWKRDDSGVDFCENQDVKRSEQNFIRFCNQHEKKPPLNYSIPPSDYSIPPIIHFIWLGSPVTHEVQVAIESWKKHHSGWEIKVWTDEVVEKFLWTEDRLRIAFEEADTWAEKADILRLDILYQFGGIYSDVDVLCLNSFHDLIVQDVTFFSSFELNFTSRHYGEAFYVGTAIMGASKGSPLMKYCLDHCKTYRENPTAGILKRTGPGLVSRACLAGFANPQEHILILPCSYIYPLPWKNKGSDIAEYISKESLAVHFWASSWVK
jgi:inositol phosphorylceramide mannosyltransferase catalytic subunit